MLAGGFWGAQLGGQGAAGLVYRCFFVGVMLAAGKSGDAWPVSAKQVERVSLPGVVLVCLLLWGPARYAGGQRRRWCRSASHVPCVLPTV